MSAEELSHQQGHQDARTVNPLVRVVVTVILRVHVEVDAEQPAHHVPEKVQLPLVAQRVQPQADVREQLVAQDVLAILDPALARHLLGGLAAHPLEGVVLRRPGELVGVEDGADDVLHRRRVDLDVGHRLVAGRRAEHAEEGRKGYVALQEGEPAHDRGQPAPGRAGRHDLQGRRRAELELVTGADFAYEAVFGAFAREDEGRVDAQLLLRDEDLVVAVDHEYAATVVQALVGALRRVAQVARGAPGHDGDAAEHDRVVDAPPDGDRLGAAPVDLVVHHVHTDGRRVRQAAQARRVRQEGALEPLHLARGRPVHGDVGELQVVGRLAAGRDGRDVAVLGYDRLQRRLQEVVEGLDLVAHQPVGGEVVLERAPHAVARRQRGEVGDLVVHGPGSWVAAREALRAPCNLTAPLSGTRDEGREEGESKGRKGRKGRKGKGRARGGRGGRGRSGGGVGGEKNVELLSR